LSKQTFGPNTDLALSPVAFAALPFRYWRGSLEYTFEIACSQYHKGRLRVHYDPIGFTLGEPEWVGGINRIVDLSQERKFSVVVPWNQDISYAQVGKIAAANPPLPYSPEDTNPGSVGVKVGVTGFDNGVLSIYVLNQLTVPNSGAGDTIQVNVFIRALDDFEVADPDEGIRDLDYFDSQSGEIGNQEELDTTPIIPKVEYPMSSLVHFGEAFVSFRTMLKRYNYHSSIQLEAPATEGIYMHRVYYPNFPLYRGVDPTATFTEAQMTLMNYLTPAFVCRKGGIRWKHVRTALNQIQQPKTFSIARVELATPISDREQSVNLDTAGSFDMAKYIRAKAPTWLGAYVTPTEEQPVAEIEVPYYNNLRFSAGRVITRTGVGSDINRFSHLAEEVVLSTTSTIANPESYPIYESYVAAGEDFTLSWFLNVPIMKFSDSDPWS
jgi:hypothetical protein